MDTQSTDSPTTLRGASMEPVSPRSRPGSGGAGSSRLRSHRPPTSHRLPNVHRPPFEPIEPIDLRARAPRELKPASVRTQGAERPGAGPSCDSDTVPAANVPPATLRTGRAGRAGQ